MMLAIGISSNDKMQFPYTRGVFNCDYFVNVNVPPLGGPKGAKSTSWFKFVICLHIFETKLSMKTARILLLRT